jgi:hypothetical protein
MHKLNYESIAYNKRFLSITDDKKDPVAQQPKPDAQIQGTITVYN